MPELPDVVIYVRALRARVVGSRLVSVTVRSPFLVRSYEPPLDSFEGERVAAVERLGKRIVFRFEDDRAVVIHPMIAGRFRWRPVDAKPPGGKTLLASFTFETGVLHFTEAGSKKRASLHAVADAEELATHDPGGLEVLESDLETFREVLVAAPHTLKRGLTHPKLFSGIGNAYSDEILHRAQLSPVTLCRRLSDAEVERLYHAIRSTFEEWTARFEAELDGEFPEKVTAFRSEMAVHGKFGEPCPRCGAPVQRIVYAKNETNYCAPCQTDGKVLKDRALSRLLRDDWPRSIEEWESHRGGGK